MTLHDVVFRAESEIRRFEPPNCPHCGDRPFLPQAAEFAGEGRIRHTWVCEGCGHTFRTTIEVPLSPGRSRFHRGNAREKR
jgi:transposase-like protein